MSEFETVAKAVKLETTNNDVVYITFQIIDEKFKQKIRANWDEDTELVLIIKKD